MNKTKLIQIRVSEEEKSQIEAHANATGLSVSEWLRGVALVPAARNPVFGTDEREVAERSERISQEFKSVGKGAQAANSYRCPRDCKPDWRPLTPTVRCPACNSKTVPA